MEYCYEIYKMDSNLENRRMAVELLRVAADDRVVPWIKEYLEDQDLGIRIWVDADPISPVAVGECLRDLLPNASLHVLPDGAHNLAFSLASNVAPLIDEHLSHEVDN
jgi:pimeloyl-ACP methyl ester carboxylesterase